MVVVEVNSMYQDNLHNAVAATSSVSAVVGVVVSTKSAPVTTINDQATTIPASVVTATESTVERTMALVVAPLRLFLGLAML